MSTKIAVYLLCTFKKLNHIGTYWQNVHGNDDLFYSYYNYVLEFYKKVIEVLVSSGDHIDHMITLFGGQTRC